MKTFLLGLFLCVIAAGIAGAHYHDPVYVYGGYYPTTSTYYGGFHSGRYRCDHAGQVVKTFCRYSSPSPYGYDGVYKAVIDHNGDYIASVYRYRNSPYSYGTDIWKIRWDGTVRTLLTSIKAGLKYRASWIGGMRI